VLQVRFPWRKWGGLRPAFGCEPDLWSWRVRLVAVARSKKNMSAKLTIQSNSPTGKCYRKKKNQDSAVCLRSNLLHRPEARPPRKS